MMRKLAYLIGTMLLGACAITGNVPNPSPDMPQAFAESAASDAAVPEGTGGTLSARRNYRRSSQLP